MNKYLSAGILLATLLPAHHVGLAADGLKPMSFSYTVPAGGMSRTIRIMHIASGTPRLAHMGLHKGGDVIKLELLAWPGDHAQVMVNGILKDDLPFQAAQPVQATVPETVAGRGNPIEIVKQPDDAASGVVTDTASKAMDAQPVMPEKPRRIVTAAAVRLRAAPSTTAAELAKVSLGTIVTELAAGAQEEKIGSRSAKWYRISLPDGREGWLFGAFTAPFSADDRDNAIIKVAQERLAPEKQSANDLLELHLFLHNAIPNGKTDASRAELEFHALLALNRYLGESRIGGILGKLPPGVASYAEELVYSEPAGMYMCQYKRFWELYEKLKDRPGADELAWKAAHQPIPGETEGFYDLMLAQANETSGAYLRACPNGVHAGEALSNIAEYIFASAADEAIREPADIPEDDLRQRLPEVSRQDALAALTPLRAAVAATSHPDREALLRRLDAFAERIKNLVN